MEKKEDLKMLSLVGLIRRNKTQKILQTISEDKKKAFKTALTSFGIVDSINQPGANRMEAITLSRLKIAVPQITASCLKNPKVVQPVAIETLNATFCKGLKETFPLVFRDMSIASLVPQSEINGVTQRTLSDALLCISGYCYLESLIIGQKGRTKEQVVNEIKRFIEASNSSQHVSITMKFVNIGKKGKTNFHKKSLGEILI